MSKTKSAEVEQAAAQPASIPLSLHEFCARLSKTVKRPALIGSFEGVERKAGRLSDLPEAYQARFDDFINKPV